MNRSEVPIVAGADSKLILVSLADEIGAAVSSIPSIVLKKDMQSELQLAYRAVAEGYNDSTYSPRLQGRRIQKGMKGEGEARKPHHLPQQEI